MGFELELQYADGSPAVDARVVLFHESEVLAATGTDSEGLVRLPSSPPNSEIALLAQAAPLLRKQLTEEAARMTIRLSTGSEVSGWLLVDGKEPEQSLPLQLVPHNGWVAEDFLPATVWTALGTQHDAPYSTQVAKSGFFRFVGLPTEWHGAGVPTPRGLLARFEQRIGGVGEPCQTLVNEPTSRLTLECFSKVRLRLRIVNADGSTPDPYVGFQLHISASGSFGGMSFQNGADEEGQVERKLNPEQARAEMTIDFSASSRAGRTSAALPWLEVNSQGVCDLGDFALPPLMEVNFLVLDMSEQPVEKARAIQRQPSGFEVTSAATDEAGETSLVIDPSIEVMLIEAPGFRRVELRVGEAPDDPLVVHLQRATTLLISLASNDEPAYEELQVELSSAKPLFSGTQEWIPAEGNIVLGSNFNLMGTSHGQEGPGYFRIYADAQGRVELSNLAPHMPLALRVLDEGGQVLGSMELPALRDGENRAVTIPLSMR